jgi:hypothetical protein
MATSEEVHAWVYEALRNDLKQRSPLKPALGLAAIERHTKTQLQSAGEMPTGPNADQTELPDAYKDQIREIIWGLVIQGIVVPGANSRDAGLPFMQISEWGKRCLEEGEYLPYDAGQYLSRLRAEIPGVVDGSILLYLQESLTSFRSGAYLASAVMTGVATEKILFSLRDAIEAALPTQDAKERFATKTANKLAKQVFDEIWKKLDPAHETIAHDLGKEDLRSELSWTFDIIRKTRNDAGHPTGRKISREEAHNLLLLFPQYCKVAYDTIDWMKSHPL